MRAMQYLAAFTVMTLMSAWVPKAWATELDSPYLKLVFTTGSSQFGFNLINTATDATVLSSASTSFNSAAVTGASVASSGTNFVDLDFTLAGGGTATGQFTLVNPTEVKVQLTGTLITEGAGTNGSAYAIPTIGQTFADQGSETYYGAMAPARPGNGLQNNSATLGTTITLADNGQNGVNSATPGDASTEGARAPFYFTSNNVGIYTPTVNTGTYTFGSGASGETGFSFNTTDGTVQTVRPTLTYDVMVGSSPSNVLQQFRTVAGGAFMPPTTAFDPYFWRDDDHQVNTRASGVTTAQGEVLDDASKLQTLKIAASGIEIDRPYGTNDAGQNGDVGGWGDMNFDNSSTGFSSPLTMISTLKAEGINTYLWVANRANQQLLTTANANTNYLLTPTASGDSPAYNLLNPSAYSSFESALGTLINDGVAGFKIDRGGEGEMPSAMQNEIPTLFDHLGQQAGASVNGANFFDVARSANDQARQYTAVWSGDSYATFAGLAATMQEGLRAGLIGFPFWGSDTGGYIGNPSEDLFARWMEYSAYCPLMEVMQGAGTNGRDAWYNYAIPDVASTASPLVAILQDQTQLHHDLIPYVQSCQAEALNDGMPIMRAMFLEFPNDPKVTNMSSEYMYGHNILVAPVTTAATTVTAGTNNEAISTSGQSVYLPLGTRWVEYDQTLSTKANGLQTIVTSAPLTSIAGGTTLSLTVAEGSTPTYVREGAIIPRGDIVQDDLSAGNSSWQPSLHIDVFPSDQVQSTFDYYTAAGDLVPIEAFINGDVLQVDFNNLGVGGTLELYMGRFFDFNGIDNVSLNGTALASNSYTYDSTNEVLTVPFTGATTLDVQLTSIPEPSMMAIIAIAAIAGTRRVRMGELKAG